MTTASAVWRPISGACDGAARSFAGSHNGWPILSVREGVFISMTVGRRVTCLSFTCDARARRKQSVLSPAGTQASTIHALWLLMLWVMTLVFVAVLASVAVAVVKGIRNRTAVNPRPVSETSLVRGVGVAVAVTVVILLVLLSASVWTGRSMASLRAASAVTIEVTGHQWWWEVAVPGRDAEQAWSPPPTRSTSRSAARSLEVDVAET